jgi:hypothetical protein
MNKPTPKPAQTSTAKLRIGQCVFVRWEDYHPSHSPSNDHEKPDCTQRASIGWISRKTNQILALTPNIDTTDKIRASQTNDRILIPIPMITCIRRLSIPA